MNSVDKITFPDSAMEGGNISLNKSWILLD